MQTRTTAAEVSNPFVTQFPAGSFNNIAAQSQAAFVQRVNISDGVNQPCVLRGWGENIQMLTIAPNSGETSCGFNNPSAVDPLQLSFLFQYSLFGVDGLFINSEVQVTAVTNSSYNVTDITITSEDDHDDDFNDTILSVSTFNPAGLTPNNVTNFTATTTAVLAPTLSPETLISQSGLSVSNNGIDISIGPFAGSSTTSDFVAHTSAWSKITGRVIDHKTPGNWRNYLVMHFLLSESTTPGMEKATLMMSAMVPYVSQISNSKTL